jgi:predicted phosphodiesterase/uncharacterized Fe-S cluster-containing radical SAM superfamily protein
MTGGAAVRLAGPVLVFGGPYSNLQATEAVLAEARRRAIPPDHIICTGDIVAYGADAAATVALVRAAGIRAVLGNCEESLGLSAPDCGCGYAEGSACASLAVAWYRHAAQSLDDDARRWMAGLPRRLDIELESARLAVIHGGVRRINRFIFASSPAAAKRAELDAADADGVIAGHCGLPFSEIVEGRLWHNAGAVGLPANDGTPRGWYSLLVPSADGVAVEHHALAYDHRAAAAAMRAAGLPEDYAGALQSGLWPSADVLPAAEMAARSTALSPGGLFWRKGESAAKWPAVAPPVPKRELDRKKFRDPARTAAGERRASVALAGLATLWFNTGTLCNITCGNCYIESSPRNDRLAYLTAADVTAYLDEIAREKFPTTEIGFTGGEPFMNPDILAMLEDCLGRGFRVLVLTNAMRPMQRLKHGLLGLQARYCGRLVLRVSVDHYDPQLHEEERGQDTWHPTLDGLLWLARHGFKIAVAGRTSSGESDTALRQGYAQLFADHAIPLDADDPAALVLFPEMDAAADVPEITDACWGTLHVAPQAMMCASQRMVVKRKGSTTPSVVPCTLLPYDERFDLGATLAGATHPVPLNHPHCAKFCVLGGGSCSVR